ncbi:type II toxin-antitoxin system RelE/ParE family toxin [Anatilimnocola aggregata]|uniref:type II toxin-antitoxin system RelE/ParE family toxin n=1 Tax=Anatilimnocola aggregata TaxID=2528021 RepID=UPI0011A5B826
MANTQLEYHRLAIQEARNAKQWYDRASESAGRRFEQSVRQALDQIAEAPERWPANPDGTQFRRLPHFPYLIIYRRLENDRVRVIAISHSRRRPGYWSRRK